MELAASLLACNQVDGRFPVTTEVLDKDFFKVFTFLFGMGGSSVIGPGHIGKFIVALSHSTSRDKDRRLLWSVHQSCLNISGSYTEYSK